MLETIRRWLRTLWEEGRELERLLARHWWICLLVVVVWTLGLRLWFYGALDMRGVPGAAAAQRLALVAQGRIESWDTWLIASVLPLCDDVVGAGRLLVTLGAVGASVGVFLAGWSIGGPVAALTAGLLAGAWARGVFITVTYGVEGPAWGIAWFGIGLAWFAAWAGRWWGLPVAALGSVLALFGAAVKGTALPALAFLLLAPLLAKKPKKVVLYALVIAASVYGIRARLFSQAVPPLPSGALEISPAAVWAGLTALADLPAVRPLGWLPELSFLALLGALIPGRGFLVRLALGGGSVVVMGLTVNHLLTADHLGEMLKLRYLVPPSFGLFLLAGTLVAALSTGWAGVAGLLGSRLPWSRLRPLFRSTALVLSVVLAWVTWLDAVSYMRGWSLQRQHYDGAEPASLPVPPAYWESRYAQMDSRDFFSTSAIGAIDLYELSLEAPARGVAGVPLRDERESHLYLAAAMREIPHWILHAQRCCPGGTATRACANEVAASVDQAGVLVLLPRTETRDRGRVDGRLQPWVRGLYDALEARGELEIVSPWWVSFQGSGEGEMQLCRHRQGQG